VTAPFDFLSLGNGTFFRSAFSSCRRQLVQKGGRMMRFKNSAQERNGKNESDFLSVG
jgi:hypothetical protein